MDIQHSAMPGINQQRAEQAKISSETDYLHLGGAQRGLDRRLMRDSVAAKGPVVDGMSLNTGKTSSRQTGSIWVVRQDQDNFGWKSSFTSGYDQRLHVGAAAADQDGGAGFHASQPDGGSKRTNAGP